MFSTTKPSCSSFYKYKLMSDVDLVSGKIHIFAEPRMTRGMKQSVESNKTEFLCQITL